jgi:hypothetical protein
MKQSLLVASLIIVLPAFAADPPKKEPKAYTDPEKAGPDFKIQGEYVGETPAGKVAAQVIAEGNGQFTVRLLKGGLPGDGWDETTQARGKATTSGGKVTFEVTVPNGQTIKGEIGNGMLVGTDSNGKKGELKRVVRHSPYEGTAPPPGGGKGFTAPSRAIVLFDSTTADAWDHGKIENGLLTVSVPGGQTSKQKFGDFTAHVEFILPFMPKARGQGRGNSGVYCQGRYEIQVLDSFGLEGKNNECGGIYTLHAPKVNMCYPPLQWQTYDIEFTAAKFGPDGKKTANARITVKHNGVLIQDDVELKKLTGGSMLPDNAEPGPIHLQNHGDPVFYRNIWVVPKK